MSANLNAAEVLQGVVSTPAALEAVLNQGAMIVNDYVITIEAVDGGYKLIARRGSDEQSMVILNGVDAPVPDIKITDVVHGHDVTITVGDVAKTFYIHDGVDAPVPEIDVETVQGGHKVIAAVGDTVKSFIVKDGVDGKDGDDAPIPEIKVETISGGHKVTASVGNTAQSFNVMDGKDGKTPVKNVDYFDGKDGYSPVKNKDYFDGKDGISPVINVTDIENGHRVTITTGSNVQSFDVLNGKDGEGGSGGTVEVDPTLSKAGMAADAKATGDAVKPIAAITETTTTNKIEWDGVVGDKVTGEMMVGGIVAIPLVRVSDYVPDVSVFTEQGITIGGTFEGNTQEFPIDAEEVENSILRAENCYTMELFTVALEDNVVAHIQTDVDSTITLPKKGVYFIQDTEVTSMRSLSSPLLEVPCYKVKPEALPESVKIQPDYAQHDASAPDYVKNRVAYPAYSPVLMEETTSYAMGDFSVYGMDGLKEYPAPADGKRYTFGIPGGNVYTGIATAGEFDLDGDVFPGIGIVDELDSDTLAVYVAIGSITGWFVKIPEFVADKFLDNEKPIVIIEGDSAYNKRTVPDDVILSGEGMNIVFEFKNLMKNENYIQALLNDVEIVADVNGVETVYTKDDLLIMGEAGYITDGVMYMHGDTALAMLMPEDEIGNTIYLVLVAEGDTIAKSFKVNYPGIFAPVVPAKKIPEECLLGSFIAYTDRVSDGGTIYGIYMESALVNLYHLDDVMKAIESGRQIYVCIVGDVGEVSSYYSVLRVDKDVDDVFLRYLYDDMTVRSCVAHRY